MTGLKTQESSKFCAFFERVQTEALNRGCVFFLDCGEGRDFKTELLDGEDLSGWLIPKQIAKEFEQEWVSDSISDRWSDFIVFEIWSFQGDELAIDFRDDF